MVNDKDTINYRKSMLDRIGLETDGGVKIKITSPSGETNFMNISLDELNVIKAILTDGNRLKSIKNDLDEAAHILAEFSPDLNAVIRLQNSGYLDSIDPNNFNESNKPD